MKQKIVLSLIFTSLFFISSNVLAEEDVVILGKKTDQGYEIGKGSYLDLPEDITLKKVGNNVITRESTDKYIARKFERMEKEMIAMESRLQTRIDQLEARLNEIPTKEESDGVMR